MEKVKKRKEKMNKDVITGFIVAFLSTSFMYITSEKVQDEIYEEEVKT